MPSRSGARKRDGAIALFSMSACWVRLQSAYGSNGKEAVDGTMTAFGWIYNYMMVPLQGTMFAILAFFIASAAYRSFRARSREAAVLLVAAVIVMMGRVPLGEYLIPLSGDVSQWILNVLNASVRRAILIGVSLGAVALSFKIIFGVERSYLGEGRNSVKLSFVSR